MGNQKEERVGIMSQVEAVPIKELVKDAIEISMEDAMTQGREG